MTTSSTTIANEPVHKSGISGWVQRHQLLAAYGIAFLRVGTNACHAGGFARQAALPAGAGLRPAGGLGAGDWGSRCFCYYRRKGRSAKAAGPLLDLAGWFPLVPGRLLPDGADHPRWDRPARAVWRGNALHAIHRFHLGRHGGVNLHWNDGSLARSRIQRRFSGGPLPSRAFRRATAGCSAACSWRSQRSCCTCRTSLTQTQSSTARWESSGFQPSASRL
jgi:hypothetical protein